MMIKQQHGSTLIVVLILLLAITIIGTLAIRQSMVSLNIATNSQAQQLMIQNSDAVAFTVEDAQNLVRSTLKNGMFGKVRSVENKGKELVFCYRGNRSQFFNAGASSLVSVEGNTITRAGVAGFCHSGGNTNFYTSSRRAVLTQVSVKVIPGAGGNAFGDVPRGTDTLITGMEDTDRVKVFAVSLMPALSMASTDDIDACLQLVSDTTDDDLSLTACLSELNVPYTMHITEYTVGQGFV